MLDPQAIPAVDADEALSRFVLFQGHLRADGSVKSDAFIPFPHLVLSVTRNCSTTEDELWTLGESIASSRMKTLLGRAEVVVRDCLGEGLTVEAAPLAENPNHADIGDWPALKASQKLKALKLAATSRFVARV